MHLASDYDFETGLCGKGQLWDEHKCISIYSACSIATWSCHRDAICKSFMRIIQPSVANDLNLKRTKRLVRGYLILGRPIFSVINHRVSFSSSVYV